MRNGQIVIRHLMNLSISVDHRLADGWDGAMFLQDVKTLLDSTPGIADSRVGREEGRPEIAVRVDRDKAALFGMTTTSVANTIRTNLAGTFLTVHHTVPHLKAAGGGSIIITSSVYGTRTFSNPGTSAYASSKAGQVAFMKVVALELGRHRIRCNAICPGMIATDIDESTERRDTDSIGIEVEMPQASPAVHEGRGDAAEVADVCLFLACDQSRHVSGVEIFVDGGASLLR